MPLIHSCQNRIISMLAALLPLTLAAASAVFADSGQTDYRLPDRYKPDLIRGNFPEDVAVREIIESVRQQVITTDKAADPVKWAANQHDFGVALRWIEQRNYADASFGNMTPVERPPQNCEPCELLLQESRTAFRSALEVRTLKGSPVEWAQTQYEMGHTLLAWGALESGTARLKDAETAFQEALKVFNGEKTPVERFAILCSLAETLQKRGVRESDAASLKKSISAYREALKGHTKEANPDGWVAAHNNLGNALLVLGKLEMNKKYLRDAVAAFRASLEAMDRDARPWDWAAGQNNLGNTLATLGKDEKKPDILKEAVAVYKASLTVRTAEKDIDVWRGTMHNLASTLHVLGGWKSAPSPAVLKEAVAVHREIIASYDHGKPSIPQATSLMDMATTLYSLAVREADSAKFVEASETFKDGLNMVVDKLPTPVWAAFLAEYVDMLCRIGSHDPDVRWPNEADAAYRLLETTYVNTNMATQKNIMYLSLMKKDVEKLLKKRQAAGKAGEK